MKSYFIYLFILFSINAAIAQDSKYFHIEKKSTRTILTPKNLSEMEFAPNQPLVDYKFSFNENFVRKMSDLYIETFKSNKFYIDQTPNAVFLFFFDKNLKVYYYSILFKTTEMHKLPELEESMYNFALLVQEKMNLAPFVKITGDKKSFTYGSININLAYLSKYIKDPKSIKTDF